MKKYITFISCFIVLCGLLGCTDERWMENGGTAENAGGLPIEFVMDFAPITPSSRADAEIGEKTGFSDGDIIQVVANFYKKADGEQEYILMEGESASCILTYRKGDDEPVGKWVNETGTSGKEVPLYWPWDADNGRFAAFYYPGFDGVLDPGNKTETVLLDSLDVTTDPLMAEEVTDISYGNAVHLTFKHKCTRLILTDLDEVTGGASYSKLWLENTGINTEEQKNAFQLELKEDKDENSEKGKYLFDFQFVKKEDSNNRVLIGGKTIDITVDGSSSKALVFFLPPGDYSKVSLTRRFGRPLFSWDKVEQLEDLEEGNSYTVSLEKLLGNITIDDDEEWWTDEEYIPTVDDEEFQLQDFLNNIQSGTSYSYQKNGEEIVVLEKVEEGHLVLRKNIDFNNSDFTEISMGNITLDGDGHFFKKVSKPIFTTIGGGVLNLGITESVVQANLTAQTPYFGLLARETSSTGSVDGVRLDDIEIHINLTEEKVTFGIGSLVGDAKASKIADIEVNDIDITVEGSSQGGSLMLGGLVGQLGGATETGHENSPSLENVSMCGDDNISIKNKAQGGNIYTGGLVGVTVANITNCKLRASVDASNATGSWMYVGGLVGSMRSSGEDVRIVIYNSQNDGTVKGGKCQGVSSSGVSSIGHSSTGGLVGYLLRSHVKDCLVSGTVSSAIGENENNNTDGVLNYYTIGGIAGAVRAVGGDNPDNYLSVTNNAVYAEVTNQTEEGFCYVGWLSGIAPTNVKNEQTNKCWVSTTLQNVGLVDDSAPTGQPGT